MWVAIFLGVLQGLTEFLPVSSSGHLVLFQQFFSLPGDELFFDLALHMGTLLPVLWVYRADLIRMVRAPFAESGPVAQRPGLRLMGLIVLGSIPTAAIGLLLEDFFEQLFSTPAALTVTFALTGALLFASGRVTHGEAAELEMKPWQALVIGLAQGLAITPGISRSGTTIAVALFLGMRREYAARFSFLLSIPAIGGAFLLKLKDVTPEDIHVDATLVGALAALVTGYMALKLLIRLVKAGDFSRFAWYVWAAAIFSAVVTLTKA
jgi:undecaprenyl-diphosphatase